MSKAKVTARVFLDGKPHAPPVAVIVTEMSSDLPADNLGELLCDAVHTAWKAGHDPTAFSVVVSFD